MLGLEDAVVGVTDYCRHPAQIVASKVHVAEQRIPYSRHPSAQS